MSEIKLAMAVQEVATQRGVLTAKVVLIHCGKLCKLFHSFWHR